ncbi:MAG: hypothetical protein ABIB43_01895 [archaeon]
MTDGEIDIKDLDKADVLAVLYNASKPQGMGFMHYDPKPMSKEDAQLLVDEGEPYFDYLYGRVMKIDISGDTLNPWGYDRDNGQGAAKKAISALYNTKQTNPLEVQIKHTSGTLESVKDVMNNMDEPTTYDGEGTLKLGLAEVTGVLKPKVDEVIEKLDDLESS